MITYKTTSTPDELKHIILLQQENLPENLSQDEILQHGFVTVVHSLFDLERMHQREPNIIIKDDEKMIGYLLGMTAYSANDIPVLVPMFELFKSIPYHHKTIADFNYIVVGQVCISKNYRGLGLLDKCYEAYRKFFEPKYQFAITEISTSNIRSINAHKRVGFEEVHRYTDSNNIEWSIVAWNWNL